ncbi:hypothetical protein D9757_007923 [Collybiopsis confluens]|uniref:Uncharacterized protein n=1 Tax=Collybiopsis confluens TaxID=2823264 RepID=A0A8H5M497_9AGAR|nr:hypothetical protein D9757_007923 [Collybiopsis confluens]
MFSLASLSKAALSVVLAVTAATAHTNPGQPSKVIPDDVSMPIPVFEPVFDCVFLFPANLATNNFLDGPFGRRAFYPFIEKLYRFQNRRAGGQAPSRTWRGFGINSTVNAKFYVDATMVMQFVDDNQYAYLKLNGIGSTAGHASSFFLVMETASAARQDLAGKFIIFSNLFLPADASPANQTLAYFRMFAKGGGIQLGQLTTTMMSDVHLPAPDACPRREKKVEVLSMKPSPETDKSSNTWSLSKAVLSATLALTALTVHTEAASVIPDTVSMPTPEFETVFDCVFLFPANLQQNNFLDGPFGRRAFFPFIEGNFTDPQTGELVARLLPALGGGFGINSTVDAKFYVDAVMVMQFVDDNQFAYLKLNGIGSTAGHASSFFLVMETASAARQDLAGKFIIFSNLFLPPTASPANQTLAYFRMFAKSSPEGSYLGQ